MGEHVAADIRAAVSQTESRGPEPTRIADHFREIQHNPGEMRVRLEHRTEQISMPPGDVADRANTREVIVSQRLEHQTGIRGGMACHPVVEGGPVTAIPASILKSRETKLSNKSVLSSVPDHIRQMLPHCIMLRPARDERPVSQALRVIGAQQLARLADRKAARTVFSEKAKRAERPQQSVQERRVNTEFRGEGVRVLPLAEDKMIEDPQRSARVEDLAAPVPVNELNDLIGRPR